MTSLIKDKFKFDFEKLEGKSLEEYYGLMVKMCHSLKCDSYPIYSNLALALAYIFFNISTKNDQSLSQFLTPFLPTDHNALYLYNYYYKILEFLAAEIDNSKLVLDEERRNATRARLVGQQLDVLTGLNSHTPQAWQVE